MNLELAKNIVGTDLGRPKKMPGYSFGISAKICISGRKLHEVTGSVCNKCYALRGNYLFPHMLDMYKRRLEGMDDPQWVDAMVFLIKNKQRSKSEYRKS